MYESIILPHFKKQVKEHVKRFRSLPQTLIHVLEDFVPNKHQSLGHNLYKLRFSTKEITKGKSKSFRLIILVVENRYSVPVVLYFKGTNESLSKKEINTHLTMILFELTRSK